MITKEEQIKRAKIAKIGVDLVSYCGHHCEFCFLSETCGGCRSDYNCCSFCNCFEDKRCPNVTCARELHLDGCYECQNLRTCEIGYYGKLKEYIAKATAL